MTDPQVTTVGTGFTIIRHRRVDLAHSVDTSALDILSSTNVKDGECSSGLSSPPRTSLGDCQLDSNVLRKVASLTLDRASVSDSRQLRPKFVSPKVDFRLFEKFEGQMLINWLSSSLGEDLKQISDWKAILTNFCTHLLTFGALKQVTDKDAPPENQFRPDCMYYWAHNDSGVAAPQTPGRLSKLSWPPSEPSSPIPQNEMRSSRRDLGSSLSLSTTDVKELARINKEQKITIDNLQAQIEKQNQAYERSKTLADIQSLTTRMKEFSSEEKFVQTDETLLNNLKKLTASRMIDKDVQTSIEDGLSSLNSFESYKSAVDDLSCSHVVSLKVEARLTEACENQQRTENGTKEEIGTLAKQQDNKVSPFPVEHEVSLVSNLSVNDANSKDNSSSSFKGSDIKAQSLSKMNGLPDYDLNVSAQLSSSMDSQSHVPSKTLSDGNILDPNDKKNTSIPTDNIASKAETTNGNIVNPSVVPLSSKPQISEELKKSDFISSQTSRISVKELQKESNPMDTNSTIVSSVSAATLVDTLSIGSPPASVSELGDGSPSPITEASKNSSVMDVSKPPVTPIAEAIGPPPPPMPEAAELPTLTLPGAVGPPPPPMPGTCGPPPPPPPMLGAAGGPPPPPLPEFPGPPPPPLPGSAGPTPPPMPGAAGPPPPPMPGAAGPPPPPMPGGGSAPPPPPPLVSGIPPPPPPSSSESPTPFPAPPAGGWNAQRNTFRKQPLIPPVPMKPLFWTRVVVPVAENPQNTCDKQALWAELQEGKITDLDEFTSLFSRQVVDRKTPKKKISRPSKAMVLKILDSKRSQNVGILSTSLHLDFSEIENAVYNFDTSVVSLEALQQIYEIRASHEEIKKIKESQALHPEQILDKPEQFLLELAEIPNFAERIACFMFQAQFLDVIASIESKLNNLKSVCQTLVTSENLKNVLAIILAVGNFMNGGNRQRGQADGFGLEILSKLKDVKSQDNSITLLHFIVKQYIRYLEESGANSGSGSLDLSLPTPEPGDIDRASNIVFEEIENQIIEQNKQLVECVKKMNIVIASSSDNVEPFKTKMESFVSTAKSSLKDESDSLDECKQRFISLLIFYQFNPGGNKLDDVSPKDFFSLWTPFCIDFKDLWKKEQHLKKAKIQEALKKQKEIKRNTRKLQIGGFKSTLLKFEKEVSDS